MQVYTDAFEEIDFYDCYFKSIIHKGKSLIIPAINAGVSEHPLNPNKEIQYLNYSYAIFGNVTCFFSGDDSLDFGTTEDNKNIYYFGGFYLSSRYHLEGTIYADSAQLVVEDNYQMRKEPWIPVDTPKLPRNMEEEAVQLFFL